MKKIISLLTAALFFTGCASTHPGTKAVKTDQPSGVNLVVSSEFSSRNSDDVNFYWDVTFENKDANWVRAKSVIVEFPEAKPGSYEIMVGDDLLAWISSTNIKNQISDHNTAIAASGLVLIGAVALAAAGGGRGGDGAAAAGVGAMTAGLAVDTTQQVRSSLRQVETANQVPSEHILAPIRIPGRGVAKKWFMVSAPAGGVGKSMKITMTFADGSTGLYEIPLYTK